MAHQRKTIRDNVITTLTGLATTGSRVYNTRILPNLESNLPCLNVYTISESSEEIDFLTSFKKFIIINNFNKYLKGIERCINQLE